MKKSRAVKTDAWLELEKRKLALREKEQASAQAARQQRLEQQRAREHEKTAQGYRKATRALERSNDAPATEDELADRLKCDRKMQAYSTLGLIKRHELTIDCSNVPSLSRKPEPWEDLRSWLITVPPNAVPKEWFDGDELIKVRALNHVLGGIKGINESLDMRFQINIEKLTMACAEEIVVNKSEIHVHDFNDRNNGKKRLHVHFPVFYTGRACRSSFYWEDALKKNCGLPICDVSTFTQVLLSHYYRTCNYICNCDKCVACVSCVNLSYKKF